MKLRRLLTIAVWTWAILLLLASALSFFESWDMPVYCPEMVGSKVSGT
jgi:hypothetical protein